MSFNQYMHPRNIYRNPPDFKKLAAEFSDFKQYVKEESYGKAYIDFKNVDALRSLTRSLLKKDFNLDVEIPPKHLIPTLPLRLNYILWIEDLLATLPENKGESCSRFGLDIGTGTTCIYPLLGSRKNGWKFLAIDADNEAFEYAKKNVQANNLEELITVKLASSESSLSDSIEGVGHEIDFAMCNPPFFRNEIDACHLKKSRSEKGRPEPKTANCPNFTESITDGGEVNFIKKILQESLTLKERIKIYTTMLGKKQSIKEIKRCLYEISNEKEFSIATTEFCQGHTMRWGIAWSFVENAHLEKAQTTKKPKEKLNKPQMFVIQNKSENDKLNIRTVLEQVEMLLNEITITYTELKVNKNIASLRCLANENTWSHQRKRRRALLRQQQTSESSNIGPSTSGSSISNMANSVSVPLSEDIDTLAKRHKSGQLEATGPAVGNETAEMKPENGISQHVSNTDVNVNLQNDVVAIKFPSRNKVTAVEFLLIIRRIGGDVVLELQYLNGSLGKDSIHQILQYLKNKLNVFC